MARSARSTLSRVNGKKASPSSSPVLQTPNNGATMATVRTSVSEIVRGKRKRKNDRWWRISDDKVKEAKTNDVLGMQREVYLLFYELETEDEMTKE
jgi:ubiquitin carboxyl-terminal hydrolase 16